MAIKPIPKQAGPITSETTAPDGTKIFQTMDGDGTFTVNELHPDGRVTTDVRGPGGHRTTMLSPDGSITIGGKDAEGNISFTTTTTDKATGVTTRRTETESADDPNTTMITEVDSEGRVSQTIREASSGAPDAVIHESTREYSPERGMQTIETTVDRGALTETSTTHYKDPFAYHGEGSETVTISAPERPHPPGFMDSKYDYLGSTTGPSGGDSALGDASAEGTIGRTVGAAFETVDQAEDYARETASHSLQQAADGAHAAHDLGQAATMASAFAAIEPLNELAGGTPQEAAEITERLVDDPVGLVTDVLDYASPDLTADLGSAVSSFFDSDDD